MRPICKLGALLTVLASGVEAGAQETSLSVSAGATWSDNIRRTRTSEESEFMPEAGVQLSLTRSGRLDAKVAMDLQYRSYEDNTFDDELVGGLNGLLTFDLVPDLLNWTVEDNFGQGFIDPQAVETPDNRQNFNYFSTGPTISFRLGSRSNLTIATRWSDVDYEASSLDSERLSGSIAVSRALSESSSLSLNLTSQRVEFDDSPPNSDYDLHSGYLNYRTKGARTTLSLKGGVTSLRDSGSSTDGPLVDVTFTRAVGARSTLTLNVGTHFNDAAESYRREREFLGIVLGNQDIVPSGDAFQQDYAIAGWTIQGSRTTLELSANWRNEDHEVDSSLDREQVGAGFNLSRRIRPRFTGALLGSYGDENYDVGGVEFDEWTAGIELGWELTSKLSISLRGEHFEESGDTSTAFDQRDYEENRYSMKFRYTATR